MKRIMVTILASVITLGLVTATEAGAGWFKKSEAPRTEKPDWMKKPRRYENLPAMSFHSGVLQQEGWDGWKLGEVKLQLAQDCLITTAGAADGFLRAGRQATVMGPKVGDTIVAWSVRVTQESVPAPAVYDANLVLRKSEANPNCGEIVQAPQ